VHPYMFLESQIDTSIYNDNAKSTFPGCILCFTDCRKGMTYRVQRWFGLNKAPRWWTVVFSFSYRHM